MSADDFAFSPDGSKLALIACDGEAIKDCWLYIVDTTNGEAEKILDLYSGHSPAWSPDGSQVALDGIRKGAAATGREIIVVDVKSGEVFYTGQPDRQTNSAPPDSPISAWGVQFPIRRAGLESCTAPP